MMKMNPTLVAAFLLSLALGSCALPSAQAEQSSSALANELVLQLEQRADLRDLKILVLEFSPVEKMDDGRLLLVNDASMAAQHQQTASRLRHSIMGSLAPRVAVIEPPIGPVVQVQESGEAITLEGFEMAQRIGASAVLTGFFTMIEVKGDHKIQLFLRLVSVEDRVILAATEGMIQHPTVAGDMDHME
jgi:flagellar FlgO protein